MSHEFSMEEIEHITSHSSLKNYLLGFILSVALTGIAFFIVTERLFDRTTLMFTIAGLGFIQAWVQLYFFMHLGKERKPRWNLIIFFFMFLVVVILVGGTLWIMFNVNERTMPPMEMEHYMLEQEGIKK